MSGRQCWPRQMLPPLLLICVCVFGPGRGGSSGGNGEGPKPGAGREGEPRPAGSAAAPARFKNFSYLDREGMGIEAFRMLIPADWQFEGGIIWVLDNPGMPATARFRVTAPDGSGEFEVFPNQPFFWSTNQMLLSTFPVGSRYFGNEVHPPLGPPQALKEIILPRFRGDARDLRIVSEENLPDLAKELGAGGSQPGISTSAAGARVRVEYTRGGTPVEEDIYAVVESVSFPIQTMYGPTTNTNWYVDYIFSFKAPKGTLDAQAKNFQTIARSFSVNPQWFSKYNQLVEYLIQAQIRQIRHVGELSRIISQTSNEISDLSMQAYNNRQKVNDRIADNFSRYIRGVDAYYDPVAEKKVELPSGYNNVWCNASGEYILSEDPNYNPNIGSNLNWQEINKTQ